METAVKVFEKKKYCSLKSPKSTVVVNVLLKVLILELIMTREIFGKKDMYTFKRRHLSRSGGGVGDEA